MVSEGLIMPTGVAIGPDSNLYISNCGVCAGGGEVLFKSLTAPPSVGDTRVTPLVGSLVGIFGLVLVLGGGYLVRRQVTS